MECTEQLVRGRGWWPGLRKDVKERIDNCERCALAKGPYLPVKSPMKSICATRPLEVLAVDFTLMDPSSGGRENREVQISLTLPLPFAYS